MAGDSGSGNRVFVIGVGMTKFCKPGRRKNDDGSDWDYPDMAREAGTKALADAGIDYREVQEAYVGYVYGESTSGHEPGCIFSKPRARVQSAPPRIALAARYSAVEPVEQLLLTFTTRDPGHAELVHGALFDETCAGIVGDHMNRAAAQAVYDQAGLARTTSR